MTRILVFPQSFAAVESDQYVLSTGERGYDPVSRRYKTGDGRPWDRLPFDEELPGFDAHTYGAVGDGTTDDTAALTAAFAAATRSLRFDGALYPDRRPVVHLRPDRRYLISALTIPQGVILEGNGAELIASVTGTMVTFSSASNAAAAGVRNCLLRGLGAGTSLTGVSVPSGMTRCVISSCEFDSFADSAISVAGSGVKIYDCFAQNCVLDDAALASPKGVLHIEGASANDFTVSNCEFTASQLAISASGNAYAVVVLGKAGSMHDVIAEISDHGFYVNGTHNKFTNCRADLNRGHGWVFAGGDGDLSACSSLSNGRDATNTYDGYHVTAGSYRFSACSANVLSTLTAVKHRYGFNDASSVTNVGCHFDASCYSDQHATKAINVVDPGGKVVCTEGPFINITAGATTWDVQTYRWPHSCWNLTATGATNFSTLTNGVPGQRVVLRGDGNTTLVHNGAAGANTLRLLGGANLLTVVHTLYEFVFVGGGFWVQL